MSQEGEPRTFLHGSFPRSPLRVHYNRAMFTRAAAAVTLAVLLAPFAVAQPSPSAIAAHMRFLSNDLLEGRGTGTRGFQIAAEYVAAQYEALGLEPGANGSWFQRVPFRKTTPIGDLSTVVLWRPGHIAAGLTFGTDYITSGDMLNETTEGGGQIVYVGYGITAPERGYDDYAGVSVRGKTVVYVSGAPKSFDSEVGAHYSSSLEKLNNAADHGAAAIVQLVTPDDERRYSWDRRSRGAKQGAMSWLEADGTPHGTRREIRATITLHPSAAAALFEGAQQSADDVFRDLAKGEVPQHFLLPTTISMRLISKHERVESPNVVGILRGSDPKLKSEYVVYSAHLDHLGISDPVHGDTINNGALDNASGIGAMLEVARAFSRQAKRPRRSILFLAVTGEEKGLRGSDYFANNPTVPASSLAADINIDEIFMFRPVTDVVAYGAEHSDLGAIAKSVAKSMKLTISPDPYPEEVIFVRSDQYPFVKRGVPSIYVGSGYRSADGKHDVLKEQQQWLSTIYHTPQDEMTQPLDFSVAAMVAKFDYLVGAAVADAEAKPRWKKDDFFGERFGK